MNEADVDVLVRLIGPVEIEGALRSIDRRKAGELVVYLATHPKGLDDERLKPHCGRTSGLRRPRSTRPSPGPLTARHGR